MVKFLLTVRLIQTEAFQGEMIDKTWLDEAACQPAWHDLSLWVL